MGATISANMSGKGTYNIVTIGSGGVQADSIPDKAYVDNANIVTASESTLSATALAHGGKTTLLSLATGVTVTLPAATGSGNKFEFKVGVVPTSNAHVIAALTTDTMSGFVHLFKAGGSVSGFLVDGTDDNLSLDGTTTGGLTIGDTIKLVDAQDAVWHVEAFLTGSGTLATPASDT